MAHFKLALIFPALLFSGFVSAGYAQLAPPPNWTTSAGATAVKIAANDVSFTGGIRTAGQAALNVGGRVVTMPVAYSFASNAGRFAAGAAYGFPLLFGALTVGMAGYQAYQWYKDSGYEVVDGVWKKKRVITGIYFLVGGIATEFLTADAACLGWFDSTKGAFEYVSHSWANGLPSAGLSKSCYVNKRQFLAGYGYINSGGSSPAITYNQRPPSTVYDPTTKEQFENGMNAQAVPVGVPQVWPIPGQWWPVLPSPIINPTPAPAANPLAVPSPQPTRIPQGDPQVQPLPNPNPENLPQTYKTPVIDVVPSPTVNEPWRVDVQPKDIVTYSPSPLPSSAPVPVTPPAGEQTVPQDQPPGLCEEFPDILACQNLDSPTSDELTKVDKPVSVSVDSGWGSSSAACPAPRPIGNRNINFEFTSLCNGLGMLKPIILAVAWLSAGLILLGVRGGD